MPDDAHGSPVGTQRELVEDGPLLGVALAQPGRGGPAQRRRRRRHDPVGDQPVDPDAVQRKGCTGAAGLGGDDPFGREDQPDAAARRVGDERGEAAELLGQRIEGVDRAVEAGGGVGRALARQAREHPADGTPVRGEEPLQVGGQRLGQREQAQRLRGRPAVDDHDLPRTGLGEPPHLRQREQVLDAGQHRELVGEDLVDPDPGQQRPQVPLQGAPRAVEQHPGVDVRGAQPPDARQLTRLTGELGVERVTQGVRRVRRHHQRLASRPRQGGGGGRGQGGLPDPALAGEQHDPHPTSVAARTPVAVPGGPGSTQPCSTRRLRPFNAVSMMTFSALRGSMPIIGMLRSTASE